MTSVSAGVWRDHRLSDERVWYSVTRVEEVLGADLIDHVDAEVHVQRFVTKNVLVLLGDANHLVAPVGGQNLAPNQCRTRFLQHGVESDEIAQERLIVLSSSGRERRIREVPTRLWSAIDPTSRYS